MGGGGRGRCVVAGGLSCGSSLIWVGRSGGLIGEVGGQDGLGGLAQGLVQVGGLGGGCGFGWQAHGTLWGQGACCALPICRPQQQGFLRSPTPSPNACPLDPAPLCRFDLGSILTRAHSQWHKTQPVAPGAAPGDGASMAAPHATSVAPFSGGAVVDENGGWRLASRCAALRLLLPPLACQSLGAAPALR